MTYSSEDLQHELSYRIWRATGYRVPPEHVELSFLDGWVEARLDDDPEAIDDSASATLREPATPPAAWRTAPEGGSERGVTLALLPFLRLVEDAWYYETKGELDLTEDPEPELVSIILDLRKIAMECSEQTAAGQYDLHGRELEADEDITQKIVAGRVAQALNITLFGGPR